MLEILREEVNVLVKLEQIVDFFVFCTKVKIEVRVPVQRFCDNFKPIYSGHLFPTHIG